MEVMAITIKQLHFTTGLDIRRAGPTNIKCRVHRQGQNFVSPQFCTKSRNDERVVSHLVPPRANKKKNRKEEKKPFEEQPFSAKVILSSL